MVSLLAATRIFTNLKKYFPNCRHFSSGLTLKQIQKEDEKTTDDDEKEVERVDTFHYSDLTITKTLNPRCKPDPNNLPFGKNFSDHMLTVDWSSDHGWSAPTIHPFSSLSLHPASSALHYAVELFDGLKAYRCPDRRIILFRPMANMERMINSARRACLPEFDGAELLKCITELVQLDKSWVPGSEFSSLYIRPTVIGTEPSLGLQIPHFAKLFVITCPVGPYFSTGAFDPVRLLADPQFVRAFKGGSGDAKLGANYGPTLAIQKIAEQQGCQQVLWLVGKEEYLTEVGSMNLAMVWLNEEGVKELVTLPLDGVILPGVTRQSVLDMVPQWPDIQLKETRVSMGDILMGLNNGRLLEMFGLGTACVICPINEILYKGSLIHIPTMENGPVIAKRIMENLTDIQYGKIENHPWQYLVC